MGGRHDSFGKATGLGFDVPFERTLANSRTSHFTTPWKTFPSLARSADQLHLLPLLLHPRDIHCCTYRSIDRSPHLNVDRLHEGNVKFKVGPHRHFYTRPSHIIFLAPLFSRLSLPPDENSYPTGVMYLCRNMCIHEKLLPSPSPSYESRIVALPLPKYGKLCQEDRR